MRRAAFIAGAVILAIIAAAFVRGFSGSSGPPSYMVRAIFDNASFAVQGEDVKIAGARVGSIQSLGVTANKQATVTLAISTPGFAPFHANATCAIRPQSLIGEQYVDCDPGTSSAPPLTRIEQGPGAGTYVLPVTRTSSPIDSDIVQDISAEPVRQSLAVIIGELGTALAARGSDLNAVIHRANPSLGNTDRVLKILASQNRVLARLATSSDAVLAPLARERRHISGFVTQANTTSVASAARAAATFQTFRLFPSFLRQLQPLLADLGALADQGTPLMTELGKSASALGTQYANLTPFAAAARTALINLGATATQSQPSLVATLPLAQQLLAVGNAGAPTAANLQKLTTSLDNTGAIEQLMKLLFNGTAAGNGFNNIGHYVRNEPLTSSCTNYATTPVPGCSANFTTAGQAAADNASPRARRAARISSQVVAATLRAARRPSAKPLKGLLAYLFQGGTR
jgi:phospholipid/cholesterol/gamma-HCH transport system substrate-binding protein